MNIKEGKELLAPFIERCEKDNDPFMCVHFSREDDRFEGVDSGMDSMDALIVIKQLIKQHGLSKEVIAEMI